MVKKRHITLSALAVFVLLINLTDGGMAPSDINFNDIEFDHNIDIIKEGFCESDKRKVHKPLTEADLLDIATNLDGTFIRTFLQAIMQENAIINPFGQDRGALSDFVHVITEEYKILGILLFTGDDLTKGSEFGVFSDFLKKYPEFMLVLKKPAVLHVLANLTKTEMGELCTNLDRSDAPETTIYDILREFPYCVALLRDLSDAGEFEDTVGGLHHGHVILDFLRSSREKFNISFFLLDPESIDVTDIDGLTDHELRSMRNLKLLGRLLPRLPEDTVERLAERLVQIAGAPNTWPRPVMKAVGQYIMHLPNHLLQQYINEDLVERFLNSSFLPSTKVVSFMLETLYAKRNTPLFERRFCLSLFYYPYITTSMLDEFTSTELWDSLKRCPLVYFQMSKIIKEEENEKEEDSDDGSDDYDFENESVYGYEEEADRWDESGEEWTDEAYEDDDMRSMIARFRPLLHHVQPLLRKIFSDKKLVLDEAQLEEIALFLPAVPAHIFEHMPIDILLNYWPHIQRFGAFPMKTLNVVYNRLKHHIPDDMTTIKSSTIHFLGQLFFVLPCGVFDEIPDEEVAKFVLSGGFVGFDDMTCKSNEELCRDIVEKAMRGAPKKMRRMIIDYIGSLASYLEPEDFEEEEMFNNKYFSRRVEKDMFKKKELEEKKNAETSGFGESEEEDVIKAFTKPRNFDDTERKPTDVEALFIRALLNKYEKLDPDFDIEDSIVNDSLAFLNASHRYVLSIGNASQFKLEEFGDIATFLKLVFNITYTDVINDAFSGDINLGDVDFQDDDEAVNDEDEYSEYSLYSASSDFFESLPENANSLQFLRNYQNGIMSLTKAGLQELDEMKLQAGFKAIKKMYNFENDTDICIDDKDIQSLGCYFTRSRLNELDHFSNHTRRSIFKAEGHSEECTATMTAEEIHDHFESLLEVDNELRGMAEWGEDVIREIGPGLLCGMNVSHVAKLTPVTVVKYGARLCGCPQLDHGARKAVFDKIKAYYKNDLSNWFRPPYNWGVVKCMVYFPAADFMNLSRSAKKILVAMANSFLNEIGDYLDMIEESDYHGVEDKVDEKQYSEEIASTVWAIMEELGIPAVDRISQFTKFKSVINTDFLNGLSDEDFDDAIDYLENNDDWTDAQKAVLSSKIDQIFGQSLSGSNLTRLGGLLSTRINTEADFDNLDIDECNLDKLFDQFSDDDNMFEGICEKLTFENALDILGRKPQAVCCLNATTAAEVNATFIMKALDVMEDGCHPCFKKRKDLLTVFAETVANDLIKESDDGVDDETYERLRCLAGKMPKSFLRNVSEDRMEHFDAEAIKYMDPDIFCELASTDYLSKISSLVGTEIDDDKMECLNGKQFEALYGALEDDEEEYEEDEDFPDFSVIEIGDASEFDDYFTALTQPYYEEDNGNQVQCVSLRGDESEKLTNENKADLRNLLSSEMASLFDELDNSNVVNLTDYSEADILDYLDLLHEAFNVQDLYSSFLNFVTDLPIMVANPTSSGNSTFLKLIFEHLHPKIYSLLEPRMFCNSIKKLKKDPLQKICNRMLDDDVSSQTFIEINTRCPVCILFWTKQRNNPEYYSILNEEKAAAFFNLRLRQNNLLDLSTLALGPAGLTPEIVKAVNRNSYKSIAQLSAITHSSVVTKIPKNCVKLILQGVIAVHGPINTWNKILKSRMRYYIFHLSRKEITSQLTPSEIIQILIGREGVIEGLNDPKIRSLLGSIVNKYIANSYNKIEKTLLESPQLFCLQLSAGLPRKLLNPSTSPYSTKYLIEMVAECSEYYDISPSAFRKFSRTIINAVTKDESTLDQIKTLVSLLSPKDIQKFPKEALKSIWQKVKEQDFDLSQLRVFWDAFEGDMISLNCAKVESLGNIFKVVPQSRISGAPLITCLEYILDEIVDDDLSEKMKNALWNSLHGDLSSSRPLTTLKGYMDGPHFTEKSLAIIPKKEFDKLEFNLTNSLSRELLYRILKQMPDNKVNELIVLFEDIDLSDPFVQREIMENPDVAMILFSHTDDNQLNYFEGGDIGEKMLEDLSKKVAEMSTRTLEKNFRIMKKQLKLSDQCTPHSICLEESQARQLAPLMIGARPSEMECFTKSTLRIVVQRIGEDKRLCKRMTSIVIQKLFNLISPTLGSNAGEDLESLYGCMICGLSTAQIQALSDEQVMLLQDTFSECYHLSQGVKQVIVNKIINYYGGFADYINNNPDVGIGRLLMNVPVAEIQNLDETHFELLVSLLGEITAELTEEIEDLKDRLKAGEIDATELDNYISLANSILGVLYDRIVLPTTLTRRKRSTPNSDEQCDILEDFNGNLCFLTETQINALTDAAVANCASQFQQCSYSDVLFTTLATKAKNSLGPVDNWNTTTYASLGELVGYMGTSTIQQMQLTDEVMDVLPNTNIRNGDVIFNQYLTHNNRNLSSLTGQEISSNILLIGQLPQNDLNDLEPLAVGDAVESYNLGENDLGLLGSNSVQLLANKLIESNTFNFTSSSSADIARLGAVAGGLPGNTLSALSTQQKSGITSSALQLIEPATLASAFTAADLSSFSSNQANALTTSQLSSLSAEQRNVVSSIATIVYTPVVTEGRASTFSVPYELVFVLITIAFFATKN